MQVRAPQILYVLTVQVIHIQMDLSHPVYHIQNVRTWGLLKQIQEHILLTAIVEVPIPIQHPLLLVL
ncbi:hypothetical protein QQF64_032271 [Cirrhinus molitorella]|uniref:Uncharacterized protein n=1 Tax=Cirrhinus molitorella TaxID=172907 RepID=A0ABR3MZF3_9TELE